MDGREKLHHAKTGCRPRIGSGAGSAPAWQNFSAPEACPEQGRRDEVLQPSRKGTL